MHWNQAAGGDTAVIIGHRGMGTSHPECGNPFVENTRQSFCAAHHAGAQWVELDIVPSADGDLMLYHDHFVVALDGTTRPVWSIETNELLDMGIETLDGLHEDLPPGLGLYLEAKVAPGDADPRCGPASVGPLSEWAQQHHLKRPIVLASFDPFVTLDLRASGVRAAWITDLTQPLHTTVTASVRAGLEALVVHGAVLDGPLHELDIAYGLAHANDLTLWTWYPDIARIPHYAERGVSGFCVNEVARATEVLQHRPVFQSTAQPFVSHSTLC